MPARECIVFIHAVGGDSSFWEPQMAAFSPRYHTVAVDLGGPAETVSMARFADDVAAAIAASGYGRAHLVGLSMGGVVALEVRRRHPQRVRSLTLANSWGFLADGPGRLAWAESMLADRTVAEFSQLTLPGLFASTTAPETVAHGVAVEGAKAKDVYLACWRSMLLHDQRDVLAALDIPLLLIAGEHDGITPTTPCLTDVAAAVPTARLVELRGASHFSNLDQPEAFSSALRAFLRGARAPASDRLTPDDEETLTLPSGTTAEHLLRLLELRGIELFASNSGTDFTPIIEALAKLDEERGERRSTLRVVPAPHENTAIAMAHGHALLSGRAQAVMAHVNVGTANMGLGLINARRARIPMLLLAGRTPWYEEGKVGVRTNFVQWGQDTFDQGGYFREFTKWDYELKGPHVLDTVVDRALAVSESAPEGPVYLTLPKEPLCEVAADRVVATEPRQRASRPSL
ncbi:MAG: alpha/beta fold hydrolase, partial [Myxococcales bacterium]|nr:alpha/beta fold hydrolase [Myxococcales bacterium]